jgi:hypothetical protein
VWTQAACAIVKQLAIVDVVYVPSAILIVARFYEQDLCLRVATLNRDVTCTPPIGTPEHAADIHFLLGLYRNVRVDFAEFLDAGLYVVQTYLNPSTPFEADQPSAKHVRVVNPNDLPVVCVSSDIVLKAHLKQKMRASAVNGSSSRDIFVIGFLSNTACTVRPPMVRWS